MTYTVTVTSQGQISLPAKVRRSLGFTKTNKAILTVQSGKVTIEPVKDFLELGGSLKTSKKPLSNKELHDFVAQSIAKDYAKKIKKQ